MKISRLKIFSDLATTGSFSAAAELNGVSQPAVSQAVRAMEKQLGVALIDRTQKRFALTPEGVLMQRRARDLVSLYEKTRAELQDLKHVVGGAVRVGIVPSVASGDAFKRTLRRFMEAFPQVSLSLTLDSAAAISAKIARGALDVGVTISDRRSRTEDVVPLYEEPLVAICAPSNTLVWQRDTSLQELRTFPFLSYSEDLVMRRLVDGLFRAAGIECVPARTFDNIEVLKRAVELDGGVAVVPERSVRDETAAGTLRALEIRGMSPTRSVVAVSRKNRPLTPAMRKFIEALQRRR